MTKTIKKSGFTLIELLIVIGLLAALAAVLLPSLMGDRDEALNSIDKYNQAGTLRTLRQYEAMTGQLPNGLHTGLTAATGAETLMAGVSGTFSANVAKGSVVPLASTDIAALSAIGITEFAYGSGDPDGHSAAAALGHEALSTSTYVISLPMEEANLWKDKNGKPLSFNGKGVHYLGHENYTKVIPLFITPTAEWKAEGKDWVKGFKVAMDIPATSPLPESGEFPYYIAYIGISGAGYEIQVTKTGANAANAPDIHFHSWVAEISDAAGMITDEAEEAEGDGTSGSFGSFTPDGDWNAGTGEGTMVFTPAVSTGHAPTTYTFSLVYHTDGKAELLGTSNPDCVVTNP